MRTFSNEFVWWLVYSTLVCVLYIWITCSVYYCFIIVSVAWDFWGKIYLTHTHKYSRLTWWDISWPADTVDINLSRLLHPSIITGSFQGLPLQWPLHTTLVLFHTVKLHCEHLSHVRDTFSVLFFFQQWVMKRNFQPLLRLVFIPGLPGLELSDPVIMCTSVLSVEC